MRKFLLSLLLLPLSLYAGVLTSPFESQIFKETGIEINNARFIGKNPRFLRSMRPWIADPQNPDEMMVHEPWIDQILKAEVTDILFFKNVEPDNDDISVEKESFVRKGVAAERLHSIPFPWKNYSNFKEPCLLTLQGLRILKEVQDNPARKLLLHCTVGEDRTGYLAALFNLLNTKNLKQNPKWVKKIFVNEACRGGYEAGNGRKPKPVVKSIREGLTPLYTKMAYKIYRGYLSWEKLEDTQCDIDPGDHESYDYDTNFDPESFLCKKSPDFRNDL